MKRKQIFQQYLNMHLKNAEDDVETQLLLLQAYTENQQFADLAKKTDDLTELFGLRDMSGIGISFGLDRVYDVMTELNRFPSEENKKKILILNLTERAIDHYYSLLTEIRKAGKVVDLYPNQTKMDKQLTYADKAGYTHAILMGEDELANKQVQIKNLKERKQESVEFEKAVLKI